MKQSMKKLLRIVQPTLLVALVTSFGPRGPPIQNYHNSSRQLLDGTEACSNCPSPTHQCIGRSVSDEVCGPCAEGKTFWPCNVEKECWCWDTSTPKDPGDDDSTSVCKGCSGPTESCIANSNSLIPADDEGCSGCPKGQKYWPCDVEGLCWCWDSTKPKKPPAPSSGLEVTSSGNEACDIFTEAMFNEFAPNNTFPYTYDGFCEAIVDYNLYHEEKVFTMGTEEDQRNEIAAFLGNTAHESDDFEAGREYLACADNIEVDGKTYCKPCTNDLFDWETFTCSQSMAHLDSPYNEYCQPVFVPPEGCNCETTTQVASEGELAGYIDASKVFYGRGAIQLSWNYNYIKASLALTGSPETFCQDPELVVSDPKYAWGSAIYFWMENEKEGDTCHKEALKHNFGGTLNVINGGLECPAYAGGWHHKAVKMRINRYCHASLLLHLSDIGSMQGCKGMDDSLEECLHDGSCPYCEQMNAGEYIYVDDELIDDTIEDTEIVMDDAGNEETIDVEEVVVKEISTTNTPTVSQNEILTSPPSSLVKTDAPIISVVFTSQPTIPATTDTPSSSPISTLSPTTSLALMVPPSEAESEIANTKSPTIPVDFNTARTLTLSPSESQSETANTESPTIPVDFNTSGTLTLSPGATLSFSSSPTTEQVVRPSPAPTEDENTIVLNATAVPSSIAFDETLPASLEPTSNENTIPTFSPTAVITDAPSYSPTTPAPTQGPCDGDPCPDQLCRSPWGFCGGGEGYCNELAVWSPDCPVDSSAPTVPIESFDLTDFFDYNDDGSSTIEPTMTPNTVDETPKFVKPSGGKKPPPKGKEPANIGKGEAVVVESISTPVPTSVPTEMPATLAPTPLPVLSPDDPASTYFCGNDWADANLVCNIRCPSAKSEDCPGDQSCYAFTACNDSSSEPTKAPAAQRKEETFQEQDDLETNEKSDSNNAASAAASPADNPGCTGKTCPIAGECRSQFGFCGSSFIYCNDLSSWSLDNCGLFGEDEFGKTMLCSAEINNCPNGDRMIRNPDNNCEFFPCEDVEEEDVIFSSNFVPASGPTSLPELPRPTLPTIINPEKPNFNSVNFGLGSQPSSQTIDFDAIKPSAGQVTVVGDEEDIANDEDQAADDIGADPFTSLDTFNYDEWINSVPRSGGFIVNTELLSSLSTLLLVILIIL